MNLLPMYLKLIFVDAIMIIGLLIQPLYNSSSDYSCLSVIDFITEIFAITTEIRTTLLFAIKLHQIYTKLRRFWLLVWRIKIADSFWENNPIVAFFQQVVCKKLS